MNKNLYLMRHGQTLFNKRRKIQGWFDSPLTELGKQHAKNAKMYLENIDFDNYYCSTAERTSNTLEIIIGNKPYTRLKGIKERNFGIFEGESEDLYPFKDGKLYLDETYPVYYNDETGKEV